MVDRNPPSKPLRTGDGEASTARRPTRETHRLTVKFAAAVVVLVVSAGLFEGLARVTFAWREEIRRIPIVSDMLQRDLDLDPYEMPSPKGGFHWVLRPGYEATMQRLVEEKKRRRRTLGARTLEAEVRALDRGSRGIFRINIDGFKGPELDRARGRPRILMLGDSTTFGIGHIDYPRVVESRLAEHGVPAEVINGGVEGYAPRNILLEVDRYKALKPGVVTLYVGWNALYARNPWPDAWENRIRFFWLVQHAYRTLRNRLDAHAFATSVVERSPKPDPASPAVKSLGAYVPGFIDEIERIVDELASTGADVILVTLPGLFTLEEKPTPLALKIGHLPAFTDNPYVLAKLTDRYNVALRLLAERRNLLVIDLAAWSDQALRPRDAYFADSVHLNSRGLEMVGAFMAEQLIDRVKGSHAAMKRGANR